MVHLCALYCSIWFQHGKDVQPKIEHDIIPPAAARWYEGRGSYSSRPSCGLVLQRGCVAWRRFQLFSVGGRMAASKKGLGWKHVDYPWIITPYHISHYPKHVSDYLWWRCGACTPCSTLARDIVKPQWEVEQPKLEVLVLYHSNP